MSAPGQSFAVRWLHRLADAIYRKRAWFAWPHLLLAALSVWYTVEHLEFHTSRSSLVGGDKEYHRRYMEYRREFPMQDDMVVVVESEQMEKNRQFVERLGARLEAEPDLFAGVFYKGGLTMMGRKALLFVPERDLEQMLASLRDTEPFLREFSRATNLVSLLNLVNTQIRTAREETNAANDSLLRALPALERIVTQGAEALRRPGTPPSPGVNALFGGGQEAERQMYLTFGDGRLYLVTAQAVSEAKKGLAVDRLRELVSETLTEVPGLNVGLTGEPVLERDEMEQSQKDSTLASIVSFLGVALIFIYGYNETGRPLKATLCLLVGVAYTMAYTTLTVGHLNILTITFVPILIGLAIDFGVHLITRYEEEVRQGRASKTALDKAIVYTGIGIFTGAFTTAGAFFAMAGTDFDGIQEMGVICGGGLLVCLLPMMTLLPALLLGGRQNVLDKELGPVLEKKAAVAVDRRARIENFWLRRPVTVVLVIVALSLACVGPARRVNFDYNLLNMQSRGLPAVIFQNKLIQSSTRSVLYGVVLATNLSHATNLLAAITNLPTVAGVDTVVPYLTEDQTGKLRLIAEIKRAVAAIRFPPADARPAGLPELDQALFSLHGYLGLILPRVENRNPELHGQVLRLRQAVSALRQRVVTEQQRPAAAARLGAFQQALFNDVRDTFTTIQNQDETHPLRAEDLPPGIRTRFVGLHGQHALQVNPKKDVWDRAAQEEFVADLRRVDRKATGTPVQLLEYTTLLKKSFEEAALYSLGAIAVLVLIHFRKISCVFLSLIPVGVGALWMLGLMGVCGIPFNPANVMTLPLIVGIGVTNGIHILNRFAEEQHPSILAKSTGKAVLVSGLTTIAGFGSLVLAKHRGIESLGFIMAVGTATCMFVGLTLLPAILNLLDKAGWSIKKKPAP
jgi:hypothetical protein